MRTTPFLAILGGLAISAVASAQTIDTYPTWNGSTAVYSFGNDDTATYGQTFTAPSDSHLSSYTTSFTYSYGSTFDFRFYIAEWDSTNSRITGPILFESGTVSSPASGSGFVDYSFATDLSLTAGSKYVAFTSTSAMANRPSGATGQAHQGDVYDGGEFIFFNNGGNFGALSSSAWTTFWGGDTAFEAEFTADAVPEPASMAALGFGALALIRRRRKA